MKKLKLIATLTLALATCLSLDTGAFADENTIEVTRETTQEESTKPIEPAEELSEAQIQAVNEQIKKDGDAFKEYIIKLPQILEDCREQSKNECKETPVLNTPETSSDLSDVIIKIGNESKINPDINSNSTTVENNKPSLEGVVLKDDNNKLIREKMNKLMESQLKHNN